MHFGRSPFTCTSKEGENLNDLKFGTSVGRFSSDSAASTAVKGLIIFAFLTLRIFVVALVVVCGLLLVFCCCFY